MPKITNVLDVLFGLSLLAILGTSLNIIVKDWLDKKRHHEAAVEIKELKRILKMYQKICKYYPTSEQGLRALYIKPKNCSEWRQFLKSPVPLDPWGKEYLYESNGRKYKLKYFHRITD